MKTKSFHLLILIFFVTLIVSSILYFLFGDKIKNNFKKTELPPVASENYYSDSPKNEEITGSVSTGDQSIKQEVIASEDKKAVTVSTISKEKNVNVPFTVQAPGANWDATHEEACEEASLIMVYHYIKRTNIDNDPDNEILSLINFENKNNYNVSITLSELSQIAQKYYGLDSGRIEHNISIDKIKQELSAGRPVIVPAAGKILPNPNFRNGGPNYHMLVIKGYDSQGFITNDPGTRLGKDFRYSFNDLYNAVHDWNPDNIQNGQKGYLVFD